MLKGMAAKLQSQLEITHQDSGKCKTKFGTELEIAHLKVHLAQGGKEGLVCEQLL